MPRFQLLQLHRNPTLWTVVLLIFLLISINFVGWVFYLDIREILDDELGKRLQSLATTGAMLLDQNDISMLKRNSSDNTNPPTMPGKLVMMKEITKLRYIYIIDRDYQIIAQTISTTFQNVPLLLVDREEIDLAFTGEPGDGIYYQVETTYYKRGYAPIWDEEKNIVAVLGVEASAEFFRATNRIRGSLQFLGAISILLVIVTIFILNRIYSIMLRLEERVLAADKLQSLAQLSAGVAHEIRNPLGIISGNAELLKEEIGEDKEKTELVENIVTESERLGKILTNYLEFSKPGSLELEKQDMNEILEKTLQLCHHQLTKSGIIVTKVLDENLPKIKMDSQRMTQVILNIILNAKDALLQGGWLTVKTFQQDKSIVVIIQDDAMGIPEDVLPKIFDPFFTTKKTGSGLGLSIAKRIVEEHKGKIEIQSEEGKGTVVNIILPIV